MSGKTEIGKFDMFMSIEKDVFTFQVSVCYIQCVAVFYSLAKFVKHSFSFGVLNGTIPLKMKKI